MKKLEYLNLIFQSFGLLKLRLDVFIIVVIIKFNKQKYLHFFNSNNQLEKLKNLLFVFGWPQ